MADLMRNEAAIVERVGEWAKSYGIEVKQALDTKLEKSMKRPTLTERQKEVLALLVKGNTMREVAAILKITKRTVAFHKYRMMSTLKLSSNAELIRYAIRRRIG